jgi:hypothetical protein
MNKLLSTMKVLKEKPQKSDTYNLGLTYTKYICKIIYDNDKNAPSILLK